MRCLDTRWQAAQGTKQRRWQCVCGVKGKTIETWLTPPTLPKPKLVPKSKPRPVKVDPLTAAFYGKPTKTTKEKDVYTKHKPTKSMFESTDEDDHREDFSDLGFDIPRSSEW